MLKKIFAFVHHSVTSANYYGNIRNLKAVFTIREVMLLNEHEENQLNSGNTEASEQTNATSYVNDGEFSFKRE